MTLTEIIRANREAGQHFFDKEAMSFFGSIVMTKVYEGKGGIYFVTSEKQGQAYPRLYTVRQFLPKTGEVNTAGAFQQYTSSKYAHAAAARFAARKHRE